MQWVFKQKIECNKIIKENFNEPVIMTETDEEHYINTWECWICQQTIFNDKVRDHCHITGKFRGVAYKK